VTDLAEMAEAMIGRRNVPLQRQAELAMWWAGLCWSGFGAGTIAASARASLVLGHNVVMAADPAAQLVEVMERLDHVWEQAQHDPSAAVATVMPPLIDLPPAEPVKRGRKRRAVEQPEPDELEPDALEPDPLQPVENTMTDAEFEALVLASDHGPGPAEPEPAETQVAAEPVPPVPATVPIPGDWFSAADLAQLLEISNATLSRWRQAGKCGEQGPDWLRSGRAFHYSAAVAERLLEQH
jgi:hypothetical protein